MDILSLQQNFGLPGILNFEEHNGLVRAEIRTPQAEATIYLQGAHLTAWTPAGNRLIIFLSRESDFAPGKPIRGGIPIAFPWFSADTKLDRINGQPGPAHGFARIQDWTVESVEYSGEDLQVTLALGSTEMSRSLGFDQFQLAVTFTIGRGLAIQLSVTNDADVPLQFEEALHTYFQVPDIHEVKVTGLEASPYIDKIEYFERKPASNAPLSFSGPTDRLYPDTPSACTIYAKAPVPRINIEKENSLTTVVWTPWKELPDLGASEWAQMLCVETVNAGVNSITLGSGETHNMSAVITVHND
jgi:glucose-6-phosphate 1-epimerase